MLIEISNKAVIKDLEKGSGGREGGSPARGQWVHLQAGGSSCTRCGYKRKERASNRLETGGGVRVGRGEKPVLVL